MEFIKVLLTIAFRNSFSILFTVFKDKPEQAAHSELETESSSPSSFKNFEAINYGLKREIMKIFIGGQENNVLHYR